MTKSLFYIVVVAALGGFLFGFDSGVISGCEKAIQSEFALSAFWLGLIVSVALIGTVIGVFGAGVPSDKWGRRPTLWLMGTLFLISAVGCAFTPTCKVFGPHLLGLFRFIGGLAIGGVSVVVPLYIVEVSPGRLRGRLVATNQLNIVFGILISYVSNYFVARWMAVEGGWFNTLCQWLAGVFASNPMTVEMVKWRVMLGMECLPIFVFMALLTTIPESPRWLVRAGRKEESERVLTRIGFAEQGKTMADIIREIEESLKEVSTGVSVALFQRKYLKPILLAFFIAFFNQVSGINAINYYAPRIFNMIFGEGNEMASLAGTIGVGTVNLTFTILAFFIIDKFGRKAMIIGGATLMILMHSLVAWQLSLNDEDLKVNVAQSAVAAKLEAPGAVATVVKDSGEVEFFAASDLKCDFSSVGKDADVATRRQQMKALLGKARTEAVKQAKDTLANYLVSVKAGTVEVQGADVLPLPGASSADRIAKASQILQKASPYLVKGIATLPSGADLEKAIDDALDAGGDLPAITSKVFVGTTTQVCNSTLAVLGILGFIAFFACSSGAVIWVYISEVFPNAVRAKGQSLGCFTHWFMCTIISWAFPVVAERAGTWAFAFFALMMVVQLVWAVFFMTETKGGTIEDIERRLGIE